MIGSALRDVPQLTSLELVFSADPLLSATTFRQVVESGDPHLVLRASFERWDKRPSISEGWQDYLNGRWSLWVYPVRRQLKVVAKTILIDRGLPKIADWLSAGRPQSWYFGRKVCEVTFIPQEGVLRIEERVEKT